jgi:tRNA (guanosine-2'-O-)-methyltransferase
MPPPSKARLERMREVTARRQLDWVVILENVHDMSNLAAILRTCDAVGVQSVFVLQTEKEIRFKKLRIGAKTSGGNGKWLDIHYYHDRAACLQHAYQLVDSIYCACLTDSAKSLHDLALHQPIGLLFGNEHEGVTPETLTMTEGSFLIPMYGMSQSLNVGIACAVSLYATSKEREIRGMYGKNIVSTSEQQSLLLERYIAKHEAGFNGKISLFGEE